MPKFDIKEINLVAEWSWDVHNEECVICKNRIDEPSIECTECTDINTVIGKCNHAYHIECISVWLKRSTKCPLCNIIWQQR